MIQFNLLPDVKKKYIKTKRTKRLIFTTSFLSASIALGIFIILFSFVQVAQRKSINDLTKDIETKTGELQSINDLNKILTIQHQLETLPLLHEEKPETSRIFGYLTQVTPAEIKIGSVTVDFDTNQMIIEGTAPSLALINRFSDTLKFSTFNIEGNSELGIDPVKGSKPFTNVITELSRNEEQSSYKIALFFDENLFDNTQKIVLVVPEATTTRSTLGKPNISDNDDNSLFEDNSGGGGE
jgi:hypothetical protein